MSAKIQKSRYSSKIIGKILLFVCNYPCLTVEGAYLGGQRVEVVEATVVAVGRDAVNGVHRVNIPWGQYEQRAAGAGLETLTLRLPVASDGFLLQVYQGEATLQALVFHQRFAARYARIDDDRTASHDGSLPLAAVMSVIVGLLVWNVAHRMATVAHHLHPSGPAQQEEIAKGAIAATAYLDM